MTGMITGYAMQLDAPGRELHAVARQFALARENA